MKSHIKGKTDDECKEGKLLPEKALSSFSFTKGGVNKKHKNANCSSEIRSYANFSLTG
jgi:hypothetical protein